MATKIRYIRPYANWTSTISLLNSQVDPVLGEGGRGVTLRIIFVSVLGVKTN
jgi:hypothetical protein